MKKPIQVAVQEPTPEVKPDPSESFIDDWDDVNVAPAGSPREMKQERQEDVPERNDDQSIIPNQQECNNQADQSGGSAEVAEKELVGNEQETQSEVKESDHGERVSEEGPAEVDEAADAPIAPTA